MADVTVTLTRLTVNTPLPASGLLGTGTAFTTGQTGSCDLHANHTLPYMDGQDRLVIFIEETAGAALTVVFDAGDYPPSMLKDKGSLSVAGVVSDVVAVVLEAGRFLQNDGTITWTLTGTGRVTVVRVPYPEA